MGSDNQGNRIAFGSPTTDYGVMQGEYWAARAAQHVDEFQIWFPRRIRKAQRTSASERGQALIPLPQGEAR